MRLLLSLCMMVGMAAARAETTGSHQDQTGRPIADDAPSTRPAGDPVETEIAHQEFAKKLEEVLREINGRGSGGIAPGNPGAVYGKAGEVTL